MMNWMINSTKYQMPNLEKNLLKFEQNELLPNPALLKNSTNQQPESGLDKVTTPSGAGPVFGGKIVEAVANKIESKFDKNLATIMWDREIQDDSFIAGDVVPDKSKKDTDANLG